MKTILCCVLAIASVSGQTRSVQEGAKNRAFDTRQVVPNGSDRRQQSVGEEYAGIFHAVERGILEGNVRAFSAHLGPQVFVSLPGGQNGYYSANQAFYVLQNFLSARRPQSFRFSTFGQSETAPYATGPGRFEARGGVETVQVYAAASRVGGQWVLTQVNIY